MPYNDAELIRHLLTCSRKSLGSFLLSRMNTDANLRKELAEKVEPILDRLIENRVEVRLANLIRDHGEEIMQALTEKSDDRAQPYPPRKIAEGTKGTSLPKVLDP
jgi:hypothetical protein